MSKFKESYLIFWKYNKLLTILVFSSIGVISISIITSLFVEMEKIQWMLIPMSILAFFTYAFFWKMKIDNKPIFFLFLAYLFATIFPSVAPAFILTGFFNLSRISLVLLYSFFAVVSLSIHLFCLSKEVKIQSVKENRLRILEKVKAASGFSVPTLGLIVIFRIVYSQEDKIEMFIINTIIFILAIFSVYRGVIDWMIFNEKYAKTYAKK